MATRKKEPEGRYADIAGRLIAVREHFGMTKTAFAAAIDIPYKSYAQFERGGHRITIEHAKALRSKFNVSLDFTYTGSLDALPQDIRNAVSQHPLLSIRSSDDGPD